MSITPSDLSSGGGHTVDGSPFDGPMVHRPRRPLPLLVIAYAIGIASGVLLPISSALLMATAVVCLLAVVLIPAFGRKFGGVHVAVVIVGWAFTSAHPDVHSAALMRSVLGRDKQHVEIVGKIASQPRITQNPTGSRSSVLALVEVESIKRGRDVTPLSGRIRMNMMTVNGENETVRYGERWLLRGVLHLDNGPAFLSHGLAGYINAYAEQSYCVGRGTGSGFKSWCYSMRESCRERLGWGIGDDRASASLPPALLLGYRKDVPLVVHEAFAKTGTLHILALSGMHVGILILMLIVVLKASGITRPYWVLVFIPLLTVYTIGTGASSSTVRASVMACMFFLSYLFRRQADAASSMALSALLILLVDPFELFNPGFILSFTVVTGLIVLYPEIMRGFKWGSSVEAWAEPESGWLAPGRMWRKKLVEIFGVSLAAWLASLPLIATFFHLISPVALLVNLVLLPLTAVILFTSCLALITSLVSVELASLFNHGSGFLSDLLIAIVDWSSHLRGAYTYVEAWPWSIILLWYVLLAAWVLHRGKVRAAATVCLLLFIAVSMTGRDISSSVDVRVIPTGRTNALLIDGPGDHATLFDAGSVYGSRALVESLRSRGIGRLDQVVISRATSDAYGGVQNLLTMVRVKKLVIPEVSKRQYAFLKALSNWKQISPDLDIQYWSDALEWSLPGDVIVQFLHPAPGDTYRSSLDSSLIARISHGIDSVLFMGLAGGRIENAASDLERDWNADVLVAGKCDGVESLAPDWLELVRPRQIAINTRVFDRLPSGAGELLSRFEKVPELLISITDEKGTVHIPL